MSLTRHGFIIECYLNRVRLWGLGAEADGEPRPAHGVHPGGDVDTGAGDHEDLQVTLPRLCCVN